MKILNSLKRFWKTKGTLHLYYRFDGCNGPKWGIEKMPPCDYSSDPIGQYGHTIIYLGRVCIVAMARWVDETEKVVA